MSENNLTSIVDECPACREVFPLEAFLTKGGQCQRCRVKTLTRKEKQKARADLAAKQWAKKMLGLVHGRNVDVPHISDLAAAVLEEWGGLQKFAKDTTDSIRGIIENNKGKRLELDAYKTIIHLVREASIQEDQRGGSDMTDEELEKELAIIIANAMETEQLQSQ